MDETLKDPRRWAEGFPAAITVTDSSGTITYMNRRAVDTFSADGGEALVGKSVFDCHPGPSRAATLLLYERREPNHYTITKGGRRKIIHQMPWFEGGTFAGFVEISIPIPDEMPHRDRDKPAGS